MKLVLYKTCNKEQVKEQAASNKFIIILGSLSLVKVFAIV